AKTLGLSVDYVDVRRAGDRAAIVVVDPTLHGDWDWTQLHPGQVVPVDAFSDYRGLRATIQRYNDRVEAAYRLDLEPIGAVRDVVAHARVVPTGATGYPIRLVKFGEVTPDGQISVQRVDDLTDVWFAEQNDLVASAMARVGDATVAAAKKYQP